MPKAECIIKKYILSATKNVFSVDTEGRGTNLYNNRSIQYPNTIIDIIMGIFDFQPLIVAQILSALKELKVK